MAERTDEAAALMGWLGRRPSWSQRRRSLGAGLLSILVLASLLPSLPAAAARAAAPHLTAQVEPLDRDGGEVAGGIAWRQRTNPPAAPVAPTWPAAIRGSATLAEAGRSTSVSGLAEAHVPVRVERTQSRPGDPVSHVEVAVLSRSSVPRAWQDGVVLRVGSPEATAGSAPVKVSVDYSKFRHAYGGDWASRLTLWRLPDCALEGSERTECAPTPLASANDGGKATVSAVVPMVRMQSGAQPTQGGMLVALSAGASGPAGDFGASPLAPSSTWTAGGSTGGFQWSYPMRVPPGLGGPQPGISIGYSSSSVDGRSAATNNQPNWIGEGFSFWPGQIQRGYVSCADDRAAPANNGTPTNDLCWRSDNATMSLNGRGSELIYDAATGWHARTEDGSRVEKLTGTGNGDNDGEYWKVTASDGTQYFFGLNTLPGQSGVTDSANTVRVYGNHPGEPCNAAQFANSGCDQAMTWNLDYVVDPHGNTMSYWYSKEWNKYATRNTDGAAVSYVRASMLSRIEYGTWDRGSADRSVSPTAKVSFTTGDRCLADCGNHDAGHWPDTPWDLECAAAATACPGLYAQSYWTTRRLTGITTAVWDTTQSPARWQDVDTWSFTHSFPSPGDGTHAGLWLDSIIHTGQAGSPTAMPPVTFEPIAMVNRVLTGTNTTASWQRLSSVVTESGEKIHVTYSLPECSQSNLPAAPHLNTKRCYPAIYPDPGDPTGQALTTDWWHIYTVSSVSEADVQLADGHQQPTRFTYYEYVGNPAWHYADDDGLVPANRKTWSQFRGYAAVRTRVGDQPGAQSLSVTTYLRGMHNDRLDPLGGTTTVTVPASVGGETVYDEDQFAGMVRERVVYNGVETKPVSKTVSVPWRSPPLASRTINGTTVTARFVNTATTYKATALGVNGARGWRTTRTTNAFDNTYGTATSTQDDGDVATAGDESCAQRTYNRNLAKNIIAAPKRITTFALPCGTSPLSEADVVSDVRTYYDGASSVDTPPVTGSATKAETAKSWTLAGGTVWQAATESTLDAFGRTKTQKDVRGNTTTTDFTPPSGGPITQVKTTSPLGWVSTADVTPYWGVTTKLTDTNGRVTEVVYDSLGRTSKLWNVGWSKATNPTNPSAEYSYTFAPGRDAYPFVTTKRLNAKGAVVTSYQIYDALLRPRQVQSEGVGGGRLVADSLYDRLGRRDTTYRIHVEPGAPSGTLNWEPEWSVPAFTRYQYDNAGRPTAEILFAVEGTSGVVEKRRTSTVGEGDLIRVTPPVGDTPTTLLVNVLGQPVELRQHTTTAGVNGPYLSVYYRYDRKNRLVKRVDAAGNEWNDVYDFNNQRTQASDPDTGTTKSEFNDFGDLVKTTDARDEVLVYTYDTLGRPTASYDDAVSAATKRAEWKYDRLYTGQAIRGPLTEAIRYEPAGSTNAYKWQARSFTARYQPGGANYVIPPVETGLAGTWVYAYAYSAFDGTPTSVTYPGVGGLATETVTTERDTATALPTGLSTNLPGVASYVVGQQYTAYGEPTITTRKVAGGTYVEDAMYYDPATRKPNRYAVQPETAAGTVTDRLYEYDQAGNVESIADSPQVGPSDIQCFEYDALRRLTAAWTPTATAPCATAPAQANLGGPAPYWQEWSFDAVGDRTNQIVHAATGNTSTAYAYPTGGAGVVRPHAVTGTTTTVSGQSNVVRSFGYDAAGHMTSRPGPTGVAQSLSWNSEGDLSTVTEAGQDTTFVYDDTGDRLVRRDPGGTSVFLPGQELRRGAGGVVTATRYYSFGGRTVASRAPSALTWVCADHHGTQQLAVDAASQAVLIRRHDPYGNPRGTNPAWPNTKGFVGGQMDPTGLTQLGARSYDPALGKFISVDALTEPSEPQRWDGYSYAANNPTTLSDPSGLSPGCVSRSESVRCFLQCLFSCSGPQDYDGDGTTTLGDVTGTVMQEQCQGQIGCNTLVGMARTVGDVIGEVYPVNDYLRCVETGAFGSCAWAAIGFVTSALGAAGNMMKVADAALDAGKLVKGANGLAALKDALAGLKESLASIPKAIKALMDGAEIMSKRILDKLLKLIDTEIALQDEIKNVENAIDALGEPANYATEARDFMLNLFKRKYAVYTGASDPDTGRAVAGCANSGVLCGEDDAVIQLGIDPLKVVFEKALGIRRPGGPGTPTEVVEVPVCVRCQSKYGREQFPPGTDYDEGGAWSQTVD